jgi:hypothetical protein
MPATQNPSICKTTMWRAMKLTDAYTDRMECRICGSQHMGILQRNGGYARGSWQCHAAACPTNVDVVRRRPAGGLR